LSFKFWSSYQVNFYFKKFQNGIVLVKKKVNGLQSGFAESAGSHRVKIFFICSLIRPDFNPESTRQVRSSFKTMFIPIHLCWILMMVRVARTTWQVIRSQIPKPCSVAFSGSVTWEIVIDLASCRSLRVCLVLQ